MIKEGMTKLNRILIKGGVLSPIELKQILNMCQDLGLSNISFGSRQDVLFQPTENQEKVISMYPTVKVETVFNKVHKNIVSSYLTADIFEKTSWLNGSNYLYILHQLKLENKLSINLVDPKQQFIPLFTGELNFLASVFESYWYLYLKLPHWEGMHRYPVLIHTQDLQNVVAAVEETYSNCENVDELFEDIVALVDPSKNKNIEFSPSISKDLFPYYEGMHRLEGEQFWLGLYWRNNNYYVDFLQEVADLCLDCKIGKICITPWKSIIIKKIKKSDKLSWEKLLGRFGINVRHSLLELNWHIPVNDIAAFELKKYIVRVFDQNDISTYGLTFGIYKPSSNNFFTTIAIKKSEPPVLEGKMKARPTFTVMHSEQFNTANLKYVTYAQDVDKLELPNLLIELSRLFFEQLGQQSNDNKIPEEITKAEVTKTIYQCRDCLTIYDPEYGDKIRNIKAGTAFEDLDADFTCPVCDTDKSRYTEIQRNILSVAK